MESLRPASGGLPSLRQSPKILEMRRLAPSSFDDLGG